MGKDSEIEVFESLKEFNKRIRGNFPDLKTTNFFGLVFEGKPVFFAWYNNIVRNKRRFCELELFITHQEISIGVLQRFIEKTGVTPAHFFVREMERKGFDVFSARSHFMGGSRKFLKRLEREGMLAKETINEYAFRRRKKLK
jgi:hypothetical protein